MSTSHVVCAQFGTSTVIFIKYVLKIVSVLKAIQRFLNFIFHPTLHTVIIDTSTTNTLNTIHETN